MSELKPWSGRRVQQLTAAVLELYGTTCHLCDRPGADTADHLEPRSQGGTDELENLRPAHRSCNSTRGTRTVDEARTAIRGRII